MKRTITLDDVTGRESKDTTDVSIVLSVRNTKRQEFHLDLEQESVDALIALFGEHHDKGPLLRLLGSQARGGG